MAASCIHSYAILSPMDFLQELEELRLRTPRLYNINIGSENSDYCTHSDKNKNSYLLFAANYNEDCIYGGTIINSRDCTDCNYAQYSELCYECVDIDHCYNCRFSQDLKNCTDCTLCSDCVGCSDCFGCAGLRQKQHHFFNKPLTKEEYKKRVEEFDPKNPASAREFSQRFESLKLNVPRRSAHIIQSENCVGEFISRSRNCFQCFDAYECEDCAYIQDCWRTKDSLDMTFSDGSELCYECFSIGLGVYNCNFCNYIRGSSDCEYSELLFNCKHCFGCVALQSKEFYILNKPYSREEYFAAVEKIKKQMRANGSCGKHLPTTYKVEDTAAMYWR